MLTLLLPAIERLRGGIGRGELARVLARADASAADGPGHDAQLLRHFDVLPRRLAAAAITRALDADDAPLHSWLRADPAHLRADMVSGRMLACGDLGLTTVEVDELLRPLKPLFGDEGFMLSAPVPTRWYLALPRDAQLPPMSSPAEALGDDLNRHMPAGDAGRRWRRLLSEAQVLLHNHPVNAARARAGQPVVNSVWFWGGGTLPDRVAAGLPVYSDEAMLAGLARLAGIEHAPLRALIDATPRPSIVDLRALRDVAQLEDPWLPWALEAVRSGAVAALRVDFADGRSFVYRRSHRWRFWRRPLRSGSR